MQKYEYLKSIPTRVLSVWRETAETSGGGNYAAFDYKNSRTMIYSINDLDIELSKREDALNRKEFAKKPKNRKAA